MFQDAAGTVPVTAAGQVVGRINDKSGRGNHATQATTAAKPLLQVVSGKYYLDFDGVDDRLAAATILTAQPISAFVGAKPDVTAVQRYFDTNSTSRMLMGLQSATTICIYAGVAVIEYTPSSMTANVVNTGIFNGASSSLRENGVQKVTGNPGTLGLNTVLSVGSSGTPHEWFNGRIYAMVILGRLATGTEITDTEAYVNSKTGAY